MAVVLLVSFVGIWFAYQAFKLRQYRNLARDIGLPYVLSPVGEHDFTWMVLQKVLAPIFERLPFGLGGFVRFTKRGWNFNDKFKAHQDIGKVFTVVSPTGLAIHVGDAAAANSIVTRRKEYLKPLELAKLVDMFGQSVISSEGADWQRHRRITAPPFNERNNGLVWSEAIRQSQQLLTYWNESMSKDTGVTSMLQDASTIALNVLMGAGFGTSYAFRDGVDKKLKGFKMTYRAALATCMSDIFMVFVVPPIVLSLPILPKKLAKYKVAVAEFRRHLQDMVAAAKTRISTANAVSIEKPEQATLLSSLIAKAQEGGSSGTSVETANTLSDSEIYGNLFMFSFAGHETVAMTLSYAMYLFAAFPGWQEWIGEELDYVFRDHTNIESLEYSELYPKLKRCNAVMHEVLRLYPPALSIPKTTGETSARLNVDGKEVTIPPHTHIYPNVIALQTNEEYWGHDWSVWRPNRWIGSPPDSAELKGDELLNAEKLIDPEKGTFLPWAEGPRVCPGKKFSQVEFVAAVASILWKHKISVCPNAGETVTEARKRVVSVIENSGILFTLRILEPELVSLRLEKK